MENRYSKGGGEIVLQTMGQRITAGKKPKACTKKKKGAEGSVCDVCGQRNAVTREGTG